MDFVGGLRRIEGRNFHPDAEAVGDAIRGGAGVLLDLSHAATDAKRRLIDFASGACYSRHWTMARAGRDAFRLTPPTSRSQR